MSGAGQQPLLLQLGLRAKDRREGSQRSAQVEVPGEGSQVPDLPCASLLHSLLGGDLSPAVICPLQSRLCCCEVCLAVVLLWVHLARLSVPEFASTCLLRGHCSFCVLGVILPPGTQAASASQRLTSLSSSLCEYSVLPSPPHVLQQHARHLPSPRLRCSGQRAALK